MQAVIITAYHKFDQLEKLTSILSKRFEVYVHIDKKIKNSFGKISSNVHVYQIYPINWGGCNHLEAILFLMKEAMKNPNISYFHLISGDDWPVRKVDSIYEHFENNNEIDMLCTKFSDMTLEWYETCRGWQQYYHWLDKFDYKKLPTKVIVKIMVELQGLFHVNRYKDLPKILGENNELAQGLVWGSYPRDAVEYCIDYNEHNHAFIEWLSKGQAAEEFFFQTILSNNSWFENRITNKHYRYMNWTKKNGSYPGILDMDDYDEILEGNYFFCRKIDGLISRELVDTLKII